MDPAVLEGYYSRNKNRPVAYVDESYKIGAYYILTAVIVQSDQRDLLRDKLQELVNKERWHTTEELRTPEGRACAHTILQYLSDEGNEEYIISVIRADPHDTTGEASREQAFRKLYQLLTPGIELFVLERRRENRQRNIDSFIRDRAIHDQLCPQSTRLLQISPGEEQLLWLPDLVCSAYRQELTGRDLTYLDHIKTISTII